MRIERSLEIQHRLTGRVLGIYMSAAMFHTYAHKILERMKREVWENDEYSKLPRWAQSYVQGYASAQLESLMQNNLEWRVRLDGELVLSDDVPEGRWPDVKTGDYVWKDEPTKLFNITEEPCE